MRPRRRSAKRCRCGVWKKAGFDFDRTLDRLLTSRWLGFPTMLAILSMVFWITIEGANVPSGMLATLLIETVHPWLTGRG